MKRTLRSIVALLITLSFVADLPGQASQTLAEFEIESIRVVTLPTKEDGRCWDSCEAKTKDALQEPTRVLEEQAVTFVEMGTQDAEQTAGKTWPSASEIEAYYTIARAIFKELQAATYPPEISLKLRTRDTKETKLHWKERDRNTTVFTECGNILLSEKASDRALFVEVFDTDIVEPDRIGYRKIMVGDRVFQNGGIIRVRFDRVHLMEIVLVRLVEESEAADEES